MMIVLRSLGRLRVDGMESHRLFIQAGDENWLHGQLTAHYYP